MNKVSKVKQSSICCRNRNGRKYYYCWIAGKQSGLGYDREAADAKYKALLAGQPSEPEPQPAPATVKPSITVAHVIRQYLAWLDKEVAAKRLSDGTRNYYRRPLVGTAEKRKSFVPFLEFVGEMTVDEFGENVVKDWIDTHFANGSDTYHNTLMRPIKRAFKWATSKQSGRLLFENPIDEMVITAGDSREIEITDAQWAEIETKAQGAFLDLLTVLKETGARPQELRETEAKCIAQGSWESRCERLLC